MSRAAFEPLYDTDPHTGARIEVFFADRVLAASFSGRIGWHFWSCFPGCLPHTQPHGPFHTSYGAYRAAILAALLKRSGPDKTHSLEQS